MATPQSKINVGTTLVTLFVVTLVTGIILHLKKHGILIEPRGVIKIVHLVAGFLMVGFVCWHGIQFKQVLTAIKRKYAWFWGDTWIVIVSVALVFLTGLVKLLSPVKIPNLGLWHYWLGIIMSVAVVVHLVRGIPSWIRLRKIKQRK